MTVMSTQVAAKAGFVCTASEDGHVKFWKKMQRGVEFVKHFHAHVGPIADVAASFDGLSLDDELKGDTVIMITVTNGEDCVIYNSCPRR